MTDDQRDAAANIIGRALEHTIDLSGTGKPAVMGAGWLNDVELTAWRVLHANHSSDDQAGQKAFTDGWEEA